MFQDCQLLVTFDKGMKCVINWHHDDKSVLNSGAYIDVRDSTMVSQSNISHTNRGNICFVYKKTYIVYILLAMFAIFVCALFFYIMAFHQTLLRMSYVIEKYIDPFCKVTYVA